jgi:hypothetical protein
MLSLGWSNFRSRRETHPVEHPQCLYRQEKGWDLAAERLAKIKENASFSNI